MSLVKYIAQRNLIEKRAGIKFEPMSIDQLKLNEMQYLAVQLAYDLSPESMACDGKVRGQKLMARQRVLNTAVSELQQLGQAVEIY